MKRFALAAAAAVSLLAGCGDATIHHHRAPQDPPDYHGVPTDTRPPAMIDAPGAPGATPPQ
ncbi:hypothetical protein [Trinickia symbiotica]|nr:hypothetical protein [Trinickia symbiotica]